MLEAGYELARELACSGEGWELPIRSPPNRKRDPSKIGYVSPLFNLVMDPLADLKTKDLGLSIQGLFLGAFVHADDIRTATTNQDDTAEQVKTVASFVDRNG